MAAGRHLEICKNLNNSRTVRPILTKFRKELRLKPPRHHKGQKRYISKFKMVADEKQKFTRKNELLQKVHPIGTKFGMNHQLRTQNKPVVPKSRNS